MFVSPALRLSTNPQRGGIWRRLGREGGAPLSGISALIREPREPPRPRPHSEKTATCEPGTGPSLDVNRGPGPDSQPLDCEGQTSAVQGLWQRPQQPKWTDPALSSTPALTVLFQEAEGTKSWNHQADPQHRATPTSARCPPPRLEGRQDALRKALRRLLPALPHALSRDGPGEASPVLTRVLLLYRVPR